MYTVNGWLFKSRNGIKFVAEDRCFSCESFPWSILMNSSLLSDMVSNFALEKEEHRQFENRYHIVADEKSLADWFSRAASMN